MVFKKPQTIIRHLAKHKYRQLLVTTPTTAEKADKNENLDSK